MSAATKTGDEATKLRRAISDEGDNVQLRPYNTGRASNKSDISKHTRLNGHVPVCGACVSALLPAYRFMKLPLDLRDLGSFS
jgi:hypothetical protein